MKTTDVSNCIHCNLCQKNCLFLKKYGINIGDVEKLEELAYHCFLCGKCTEVCPVGIDGKEVILNIRENQVKKSGGNVAEKGYGMLIKEKQNYIFQNYRHIKGSKSVLFPGCNFPSYYPKTTRKIMDLLREKANIGTVFECCGKPIAELGLKSGEEQILERINGRLDEAGIEEVIMLCPNCYHFLKGKLHARVVSIYEKLDKLGIGKKIQGDLDIFLPCPERENEEILKSVKKFVDGEINIIHETQCCGLGGCAKAQEPEISAEMTELLKNAGYKKIYTYCASCSGNFARNGWQNAIHILAEIMETNEEADAAKSFVNRTKTKFW